MFRKSVADHGTVLSFGLINKLISSAKSVSQLAEIRNRRQIMFATTTLALCSLIWFTLRTAISERLVFAMDNHTHEPTYSKSVTMRLEPEICEHQEGEVTDG